jgi:hypothetical protein
MSTSIVNTCVPKCAALIFSNIVGSGGPASSACQWARMVLAGRPRTPQHDWSSFQAQVVREVYRVVALHLHPDVGGDVHQMHALNALADSLRGQLAAIGVSNEQHLN